MGKQNNLVSLRIKEGVFIGLCAGSLFLLIALFTYSTVDPGWSRTGLDTITNNSAGYLGAWAADVLLYFFGYIAYLFPILSILGAVLLFKSYTLQQPGRIVWLLHLIGFAMIVTSSCGLINMALTGNLGESLPGPAGGIIGSVLSTWLIPLLSNMGCGLLFSSMLLVGITIGTGLSWVRLMEWLGTLTIGVVLRGASGLAYAVSLIYQKLRANFRSAPARVPARTRADPDFKQVQTRPRSAKNLDIIQVQPRSNPPPAPRARKASYSGDSILPDLHLLEEAQPSDPKRHYSVAALENLSREVEERLLDFGAEVKVVAVCPGPIITRFEMTLAPGLKVSKITGLAKDLARSLSVTSVRVVEVIPGKAVVGLEIPNKHREIVKLREVLESSQYQEKEGSLNLALGKDISGIPVVVNLANMPHLLVAGTTGSGKSVGVNVMLLSLLFKATPEDLRLILIDPKMLELSIYDGIAHLLTPVVTDMNDAANALRWCVAEMERRYQVMAAVGVRNLAGFNAKVAQAIADGKPLIDPLWDSKSGTPPTHLAKLPCIVVIIDEFADMMMVVGKKVEELIARIAQKARAAGIHMILATQRPSVDVITGLIKANVPTRIAFQVSSRIDSRTILDQQGAEQLLGHGDMLYLAPGTGIPIRVHGAFVSDEEVHRVVHAIKQAGPVPDYIADISSDNMGVAGIDATADLGEQDPLYDEAVAIVTETRKASISYLQRRLKIGYNRSARLIETMEAAGLVSEMLSSGAREVLAFEVPRK